MTIFDVVTTPDAALIELRSLRRTQSWTLAGFAIGSVIVGAAMIGMRGEFGWPGFLRAVGWQFAAWGAIDLVFAAMGIHQAFHADRRPATPQAEADEFAAGEKLLRTLRFNHKLNVSYLVIAALLLAWAGGAQSAALAGHGVGVAVQGGFLFLYDVAFARHLARLLATPA